MGRTAAWISATQLSIGAHIGERARAMGLGGFLPWLDLTGQQTSDARGVTVGKDQAVARIEHSLLQILGTGLPTGTPLWAPSTPQIVTEFHDEFDESVISQGTAAPGVNVHVSAILSAGTGPLPEGTVDFTFYTNGTCSGDGSPAGTLVLADGVAHPSVSQSGLLAGSYSIGAHYNGDDPNDFFSAADSSCKALIVGEPALVTAEIHLDGDDSTAVTSVVAGSSVHGAATVTGSAGDATGTVNFTFYTSGDCSAGGIGDLNGVVLVGGIADPSASHLDLTEGEYSFMAHYNGEDEDYFPADSACAPLTVVLF